MMTTTYTIELDADRHAYYVTDGIWCSSRYRTRPMARQVMRDATWGSRGADDCGTHADQRVDR